MIIFNLIIIIYFYFNFKINFITNLVLIKTIKIPLKREIVSVLMGIKAYSKVNTLLRYKNFKSVFLNYRILITPVELIKFIMEILANAKFQLRIS